MDFNLDDLDFETAEQNVTQRSNELVANELSAIAEDALDDDCASGACKL